MKVTDTRRLGLVEVEVDDDTRKVVLTLCPPGAKPVSVQMEPAAARELAAGINDGADQADAPRPPAYLPPGPPGPIIRGLPDV